MYLRGATELRQTVCTLVLTMCTWDVDGEVLLWKTNSGWERGKSDVAVATNRRGHDRQYLQTPCTARCSPAVFILVPIIYMRKKHCARGG